jgi:ParB family chromosome partitioning protein
MATVKSLTPKKIGVKNIPTDGLVANPHNPRLLFDREPLNTLKKSLEKVGVLVPLTVYWDDKRKRYVILDGQRRWICAQELKMKEVPVNVVAEPTLVQNIVTMFQIHKLREDWELMPTALKLEVLMDELKEKREDILSELTGLDPAVVSRCKKLLSYSRKFQDLMLDAEPTNRVKADFFIELYAVRNDREVNKFDWFKKDQFTDRMLEKYVGRAGIKAVTDFRVMKQYIANACRANKQKQIAKKLKEFVFNDDLTLEHLEISSALVEAGARRLVTAITKLTASVKAIDAQQYYGQEKFWGAVEALVHVLTGKLKESGRRVRA